MTHTYCGKRSAFWPPSLLARTHRDLVVDLAAAETDGPELAGDAGVQSRVEAGNAARLEDDAFGDGAEEVAAVAGVLGDCEFSNNPAGNAY